MKNVEETKMMSMNPLFLSFLCSVLQNQDLYMSSKIGQFMIVTSIIESLSNMGNKCSTK